MNKDQQIFHWGVSIAKGIIESTVNKGRTLDQKKIEEILTMSVKAVDNVFGAAIDEIIEEDEEDKDNEEWLKPPYIGINEDDIVWPKE